MRKLVEVPKPENKKVITMVIEKFIPIIANPVLVPRKIEKGIVVSPEHTEVKQRALPDKFSYPEAEAHLKEALKSEPIGSYGRIEKIYSVEESKIILDGGKQ